MPAATKGGSNLSHINRSIGTEANMEMFMRLNFFLIIEKLLNQNSDLNILYPFGIIDKAIDILGIRTGLIQHFLSNYHHR